jgi:hypothetical protein
VTDETSPAPEAVEPKTARGAFDASFADEADQYERIPADETLDDPDSEDEAAEPVPVRKRPSLGRVAIVLVVVLALLALAAYGAMKASAVWGRRAMVATGVAGIEALVEGHGDDLAVVSNEAIQAQLTPAVKQTMRSKGILVGEWGTPVWSGDSVVVTATTGMGTGGFMAVASTDDADVVIYRTSGTLSYTTGALSLERTWSGWRITGLTVGLTPAGTSTVAPSAAPTATP